MTETPEADEARERLAMARALADATARRGGPPAAITTAGVGLLVAAALAAIYLTLPGHMVAFVVSFAVYGAALTALIVWHLRSQVVARRGFGRAYTRSFLLTMTLYVIGVATLGQGWPGPLRAAYCVLVALPMVVTAGRMLASRPV
jgi:hypothetical protein